MACSFKAIIINNSIKDGVTEHTKNHNDKN